MDILRVHKVTLLPHVMYPVAAIHGKRYPPVFDMLGGIGRKGDIWEL